jgi:hypothetical protein
MAMDVAFRYLDDGEMIALSSALLGDQRAHLESIPEVKPLLRRLQAVHDALVALPRSQGGADERALQAISAEEKVVDGRHDHALRALYYALSALAEHVMAQAAPDLELAARVTRVRDELLPDGLAGTQASYANESGTVERADQRHHDDAEARAVLAQVYLEKKTSGVGLLDQWVALGRELGTLEGRKIDAGAKPPAGGKRANVKARSSWISVVSAVLANLAHADKPAAAIESVRTLIVTKAAAAATRYAAARKHATTPGTPAATPSGPAVPSPGGTPTSST